MEQQKLSLFDRLGGSTAVDVAVDSFYDKVLADPLVYNFFQNIDMKKQRDHQKKFLTFAFGGPQNYTGRNLREVHSKLKLKEVHFKAIVNHLLDTLKELGVDDESIKEVDIVVQKVKKDILNQ